MSQLDLRKQLVLDLKKEKGIDGKAQVVVAMDYSGSMSQLYRNGAVQLLVERLFPLALGFDDNGTLDFYLFDGGCKELPGVTLSNYSTYIRDNVSGHMGGTAYAPVLQAIYDSKFQVQVKKTGGFLGMGAKETRVATAPISDPVYVIMITDGDNFDKSETTDLIREISGMGMFIQFVGIGSENFPYLEKLDDLTGRVLDNVNFFSSGNIQNMSDKELYEKLLTEFPSWRKEALARNLIK